jgi:hypothetical protein
MVAAFDLTHDFFPARHCEERSDEAIQNLAVSLDCYASLAMTRVKESAL